MTIPAPGARVHHALHGDGTVLALLVGRMARVRFDTAHDLPRTVARDDLLAPGAPAQGVAPDRPAALTGAAARRRKKLERAEAARARAAAKEAAATRAAARVAAARIAAAMAPVSARRMHASPIPEPVETPSERAERKHDARQAIEAIRLGIVPARCVRDYTVAREAPLEAVDPLLQSGRGLRILWGEYGSGKTHLLEVIEALALQENLVTARVTLDPREVPPSHPQRLFRQIVRSFRLPDGAGVGLAPLLDRLVESPLHNAHDGPRASRFFSPYLSACRRGCADAADVLLDYLAGEPCERADLERATSRSGWRGPSPLALSDYRTYGRVYLHLLGVLASWSRDAGYRGLLLLFDEVEYVDSLPRSELALAQEVLDHFAAAVLPADQLQFDPGRLYRGGHSVHRELPLCFEPDQPLAVILAATPLQEIQFLLGNRLHGHEFHVEVRHLTRMDLEDLCEQILRLYRDAYPGFGAGLDVQSFTEGLAQVIVDAGMSTRAIVRNIVDLCDRVRFGIDRAS